jgi:hypothetical protein
MQGNMSPIESLFQKSFHAMLGWIKRMGVNSTAQQGIQHSMATS